MNMDICVPAWLNRAQVGSDNFSTRITAIFLVSTTVFLWRKWKVGIPSNNSLSSIDRPDTCPGPNVEDSCRVGPNRRQMQPVVKQQKKGVMHYV